MNGRWLVVSLGLVVAVSLAGRAQTPAPPAPVKADYSQEAAVIEELSSKVIFDNDGNSTREQVTRVHVQTDAGVKQWGLLTFPFQSASQTVDLDYVRVHKADGSTVTTPPDNVQDLDSEITRSAPFYSDLREKHVAVKGLGKGDTVEYAAHWRSTKPLIPGQFWFHYNFLREGIVLHERLEIQVPVGRVVKVKGPQATQTVTTDAVSRTYLWTFSRLQSDKEEGSDEKKRIEAARGLLPASDVQLSSFQNWEEVGLWYWNLQKDRIEPTPEIRAKAAELTKGMTDDAAKMRALYSFVSTQYRYIGIAFGIGRYQPHAADDVLTNSYGDCKDKHTLLASLLWASGIMIHPALISTSQKLDTDVPSPAQFDHVIGYLPPDNGKDAIWFDTTIEVAPFGYLLPHLRDKPALVMASDKSIQLVTTPADSALPNSEAFKIDAKLNDDGTLEAKIEDTSRGDSEVVLRSAFRQTPQPQWKELMQRISYAMGFAGTVSDIDASKPDAIGEPFHISYAYNRKDYPDWKSDQRITVPGMPFFLPPVRDDAKYPVWLGPSLDAVSDSSVELPHGHQPQVPANVDLKYDFAEYHAAYSLDHGVLVAKRTMRTKLREVPVAEFDDYRTFVKALDNDVNRYVYMKSESQASMPPPDEAMTESIRALLELPQSKSSEANRLENEARSQLSANDMLGAVSSLRRATSVDPEFVRALVLLGSLLFAHNDLIEGKEAFRKAIEVDSSSAIIRKAEGYGLMSAKVYDEAVSVWQEYIKKYPDDVDGPANLGNCLLQLKRYSEAAVAYETAVKLRNDRPNLRVSLGNAYLRAGDRDKAAAVFAKIGEAHASGGELNDVAYRMAESDLQLPVALDYAREAVHGAELESQKINLQDLKEADLASNFRLGAYWDTVGWVAERMSKFEDAERYLKASWTLSQDGVVAGHLCHMYRRIHKETLAAENCRLAMFRIPLSQGAALDEARTEMAAATENLVQLTGKKTGAADTIAASDRVERERTFKLSRFIPGTESAEFFVLLSSDGKTPGFRVQDTKFISGSDKMKQQGKQLKGIDFRLVAPDTTPIQVVRRGILGCYQYTGCSFVLLDPASVRSVN
jgi:tetratricopeptide (TPR) repeat protein